MLCRGDICRGAVPPGRLSVRVPPLLRAGRLVSGYVRRGKPFLLRALLRARCQTLSLGLGPTMPTLAIADGTPGASSARNHPRTQVPRRPKTRRPRDMDHEARGCGYRRHLPPVMWWRALAICYWPGASTTASRRCWGATAARTRPAARGQGGQSGAAAAKPPVCRSVNWSRSALQRIGAIRPVARMRLSNVHVRARRGRKLICRQSRRPGRANSRPQISCASGCSRGLSHAAGEETMPQAAPAQTAPTRRSCRCSGLNI
jgi:hypothetical protein